MAVAASCMSRREVTSNPARLEASWRFGVTRAARGMTRFFKASTASSWSSASPCFETKTGSMTRFRIPVSSTASATASMMSAEESIPVFAASTPMSSAIARIWAATTPDGTSDTSVTPSVFCTVTEVRALIPHTPSTANVFRSAWMPAPPPESEPAMVKARGITERSRSPAKVVPPFRREGAVRPVGCDRGEPFPLLNLPDVGQRRSEPLTQLILRLAHGRRRQRRQQLVVLSARQREVHRLDVYEVDELGQPRGHRDVGQADGRGDPTLAAQPGQVQRQSVRDVHHRGGPSLRKGLALADPSDRAELRREEVPTPRGRERRSHLARRSARKLEPPGRRAEGARDDDPVPGLAPALVTAASFGTSPVTATATTTRSARTVSPPTTDTAYSAAASRMPPYSSTTQAASASGGRPSEIRPYRGLPPIAATSLTFTTTALYPRSRAEIVDRSQCTPSTSMSAVSTALCHPMPTTAASSPGPTRTP